MQNIAGFIVGVISTILVYKAAKKILPCMMKPINLVTIGKYTISLDEYDEIVNEYHDRIVLADQFIPADERSNNQQSQEELEREYIKYLIHVRHLERFKTEKKFINTLTYIRQ
jgi:hypothetical protein